MRQKNLVLDKDSLNVILNMIRQGGEGTGVIDTLNVIREFIVDRVRDPEEGETPGAGNALNLNALLNPIPTGRPIEDSKAIRSGI